MNKRILHAAAVLAAVFACLFAAVTPANALNFNGSASGGGSGSASTNASGSYGLPAFVDSEYNAAPAYRFTLVNSSGNDMVDSVDIYRSAYSKYMATGYHKFSTKYPKTMLKSLYSIGSFSTSATNTNCYIDTSILGISLPTRTTGMEAWSTETNMSILLEKAWGCSISDLEQNGWCILVEPIYPVKLEGQDHSLTVTEMAVYGAAKFGASTVPASGTNTDSWDWISNYTNKLYPNALRLSKDYVGLSAVSELSSRASFGTIITQGYGAAVVYGEYTTYHYLDVNGYLDGAEYGATTGYGTFDVYINGSLVADDVSDYWVKWPAGTTYSITDIKAATGKTYHWVHSGYQSGTIYSAATTVLTFTTTTYNNTISHFACDFNGYGNYEWNRNAFFLGQTTVSSQYNNSFTLDRSNAINIPNGFYLAQKFGTSAITGSWVSYPMGTSVTQKPNVMGFEYDYNPISYKIKYNLNGGTNNSSNPSAYDVLDSVYLKNPTRDGYIFEGWYGDVLDLASSSNKNSYLFIPENISFSNDVNGNVLSNTKFQIFNESASAFLYEPVHTTATGEVKGQYTHTDSTGWYSARLAANGSTMDYSYWIDLYFEKGRTYDISWTQEKVSSSEMIASNLSVMPSSSGKIVMTNSVDGNSFGNTKFQIRDQSYNFLTEPVHTTVTGEVKGQYTHTYSTGYYKICFGANGSTSDTTFPINVYLVNGRTYDISWTQEKVSASEMIASNLKMQGIISSINPDAQVDFTNSDADELNAHLNNRTTGDITLTAKWNAVGGTADKQLTLIALDPNAPYREKTEVVTSYWIVNSSDQDCIPTDDIKVRFTVYNINGDILEQVTKTAIVPANDKNLLYFKWKVPTDLSDKDVIIKAVIIGNDSEYGLISKSYATIPYLYYSTPDTQYEEKAPDGFSVPSVPTDTGILQAKWWEYKYENGTFEKVHYGIGTKLNLSALTAPNSLSAVISNGKLTLRSGYGFRSPFSAVSLGIEGYTVPDISSYSSRQYAFALFPEFNYTFGENKCKTMREIGGLFNFGTATNELTDHYIPLYYPDGEYTFKIVTSDSWTPAGMITTSELQTLNVSGTLYDDHYIGRK